MQQILDTIYTVFDSRKNISVKEMVDIVKRINGISKEIFIPYPGFCINKETLIEVCFKNDEIENSLVINEAFKKFPILKDFYEENKNLEYGFYTTLNKHDLKRFDDLNQHYYFSGIIEGSILGLFYTYVLKDYFVLLDIFYKFFLNKNSKITIRTGSYNYSLKFDENFIKVLNKEDELVILNNLNYFDLEHVQKINNKSGLISFVLGNFTLFSTSNNKLIETNEVNAYLALYKNINHDYHHYSNVCREVKKQIGERAFSNVDKILDFFESHI